VQRRPERERGYSPAAPRASNAVSSTPPRADRALSARETERGMRLSIVEGMAYAFMVGVGETFFLADATRLAATRTQQGLVVALPLFVGALGALGSLALLARMRARKPLVAVSACLQACVLTALAVASALGRSTPELLIAATTLAALCGQAGSAAWSSWFGDLVPSARRGQYFGVRNRWIYLTTFAGVLVGGQLLNGLEPDGPVAAGNAEAATGGTGFAVVYGLAALARFVSAALHALAPEPAFGGLSPRARAARFLATDQGRGLLRIVIGCATFYFAVYFASPYFAPFMLEVLQFDYVEYTVASAAVIVSKVTFLSLWGRRVDQLGARPVFLVSAVLTSIVPLPFLWADGLAWVIVAQTLSGVAWAGYELSIFTLVLERTYRRVRPQVFALLALANGLAQLAGSLAGAEFIGAFALPLVAVFAVSFAGRMLISAGLVKWLPHAAWETPLRRREVLFRVVGFRVSGGLGLRPMSESARREPPRES